MEINKETKSEVERLYAINDKLLNVAEKALENEKVPSKEVLDTIQIALTITAKIALVKI